MSGKLFTDNIHIFKEVIRLAESLQKTRSEFGYKGSDIKGFLVHQLTRGAAKVNHAEVELENYISSLPFEDIKMLQTVMYLGRDQEYNLNHSSQEIYQDYFNYLERLGWRSKEIVVSEIVENTWLADDLRSGLGILEVNVN